MTSKFSSVPDCHLSLNILLWSSIFFFHSHNLVMAQVVEDGTLSTEVNSDNNQDFRIDAGEQRGNNLFHSFAEFSIPNNGSVSFNNGLSIQNIITRVTGDNISNLNGLIQSNGTANLFLINPNGIIFGENARLNIGGSFVGTTAASVVFEDGTEFNTSLNNSETLLTVSVPLGLQFGSNPGEIINQANFSLPSPADPTGQEQIKLGLSATPGTTLALLGGDITFDGGAATAPQGNIEIGSVAQDSFVALESIAQGWQANYEGASQFQDVQLNNLARVDASGAGGGRIHIRGDLIQVLDGSAISSTTVGSLNGQDITVTAADFIQIKGTDPTNQSLDPDFAAFGIFVPLSSSIKAGTIGQGNGGNIRLNTNKLFLEDGSKIQTQTVNISEDFTQQLGNGGDILIDSDTLVEIKGQRTLLGVAENASELLQELFAVSPEAQNFIDLNRALVSAQGSSIDSISASSGDSGTIDINTSQLKIADASSISNSPSPFSMGEGGDIQISSTESIEISGSSELNSPFVSIISANTFGRSNAGNITLNTDKLLLQNGGGITAGTLGSGNGGEINISTTSIEIKGTSGDGTLRSGFGSEAFSVGSAGDVMVSTGDLSISDRGQITVRGLSSGTPGNLTIDANTVRLNNSAAITAENAAAVNGGNIKLNIVDSLTLEENSLISAQAFGSANGGNIDLEVGFLIANPNENSDILATAVRGDGGKINILSEGIFGIQEVFSQPPNSTNNIDASSEFGLDGTVSFNFPEATNSNFEEKQASTIIDVRNLLNNSFCKVSLGSKYYAVGKGGMTISPDRDLLIEDGWTDFRFFDESTETEKIDKVEIPPEKKRIEPIQGWFKDSQGKLVLTTEPLVTTTRLPISPRPDCNTKTNN